MLRLQTAIKLLLKENPVLPNVFNFNGRCLLQSLRKEAKNLGYEESVADAHSPSKKNIDSSSKMVPLSPGADPFDVDQQS